MGLTYHVSPDTDAENPREWDRLGTMLFSHRRHTNLGDEKPWWWEQLDQHGYCPVPTYDPSYREWVEKEVFPQSWDEREELLRRFLKQDGEEIAVLLNVYMYEHSGRVLRASPFGDRWDSGQLGFFYATKSEIRAHYKVKNVTAALMRLVEGRMKADLETYNAWIEGDVWCYHIYDGNEFLESGCNYYGQDQCKQEAKKRLEEIRAERRNHQRSGEAQGGGAQAGP